MMERRQAYQGNSGSAARCRETNGLEAFGSEQQRGTRFVRNQAVRSGRRGRARLFFWHQKTISRWNFRMKLKRHVLMKAMLLLIIALALCSTSAIASVSSDLAAIDAHYKACMAKDSDNVGLKECTHTAYSEADKVLTKTYRSIQAALKATQPGDSEADDKKEEFKRLLASERAWITYRDAECDLQGVEMLGGSGEGLVIGTCLYSLTAQRVKDLDDLFGDGVPH
jgi:uncharacterized protein YecT (DUF1311 family)